MSGIAIDLGSAYSTAARLNDQGIPTLIPDMQASEQLRTRSLVYLGANGPFVGAAAEIASSAQPEATIIDDAQGALGNPRTLAVDHTQKGWTAQECVALLLSKLQQDAHAHCFEAVNEVLLTVPARFGSAQRRALRQVAEGAGLRVRALVDESLAAATYAIPRAAGEQTVLVMHSGRSAFDVTVIRRGHKSASIIASRSDVSLGGKAIDERLAGEICKAQGWMYRNLSVRATQQVLHFAEQLKLALYPGGGDRMSPSGHPAQVQRQGIIGKSAIDFVLTQWHFQQLIAPLVEGAAILIDESLAEAGLSAANIDRVVVTGGNVQLSALRDDLLKRFNWPQDRVFTKDATTAIAYGAALLAARCDEELSRYDCSHLKDDLPAGQLLPKGGQGATAMFDVGIRIGDPRSGQAAIYKLIKRGAPLPARANKQFRTSRPGQPRLIIEGVKSNGTMQQVESLGHFALALPPGLPAGHPVLVTMFCDATGQIRVEAESMPIAELART